MVVLWRGQGLTLGGPRRAFGAEGEKLRQFGRFTRMEDSSGDEAEEHASEGERGSAQGHRREWYVGEEGHQEQVYQGRVGGADPLV